MLAGDSIPLRWFAHRSAPMWSVEGSCEAQFDEFVPNSSTSLVKIGVYRTSQRKKKDLPARITGSGGLGTACQ